MTHRNTRLAAAVVAVLAIIVGGSVAQQRVGSGHALDSSLMVGSGGYNYGKFSRGRGQTVFYTPRYSPAVGMAAGPRRQNGFGVQGMYRPSTSLAGRRVAYGRTTYGRGRIGGAGRYGGRR